MPRTDFKLTDLRPTQFVLGMKEVANKVKKIRKMSVKELRTYCDSRVIPVVLGPSDQAYIIDHHHFTRACWETQTECYSTKIIEDWSALRPKTFWNQMVRKHWTYLHDQFGLGPHSPLELPTDIRGLADDPYRSLAWAVREEGGFKKVDVPFFEFQWAEFLRQNLDIAVHSKSDFKEAIPDAIKLCRHKDANHLPGYVGN